ncbi:deacetylase [Fusarium austroafricanum]|uniref:Deacetylase n=1 Tax=Fusarium austroafricanum TaxID=2364996 RepID=A0A8H4JGE3_9HYPO|nr:deacetylase [Fusarium austroafricanum]
MRCLTVLASVCHLASALSIPTYPKKRAVSAGFAVYGCTQPDTIALTFDDGPFVYTDSVLNQLASAGMKATFFLNGYNLGNIMDYQSTVNRMISEGHQVASHTHGHPDLAGLGDFDVEQQMSLLSNEFSSIIGKYPVYMRPPYFSFNTQTLRILGQLGYKVIIADIDTDDWRYSFGGVEASLASYYTGLNKGGSIVLMHDVHQNTAQNILPRIIQATLGSGKRGVTVGECLGDPETNWYRGGESQATEWNVTETETTEWNNTRTEITTVVQTSAPERAVIWE